MVTPLQPYPQVKLNGLIGAAARQLLQAFTEFENSVDFLEGTVTDEALKAGKLVQGWGSPQPGMVAVGQPLDTPVEPITDDDYKWYVDVIARMGAIVADVHGTDRKGAVTLLKMLARVDQ